MQEQMVHVGKKGWLYLVGGSNKVLDYYIRPDTFSPDLVAAWIQRLKCRLDNARALNARYIHVIAPEKLSVYPEFFGDELPHFSQAPAVRFPNDCRLAGIEDSVIDLLPRLRNYKVAFKLYWQTDTHWTPFGCFFAYEAICEHLGIPANRGLLGAIGPYSEILLDLGSKLDPPRREAFAMLQPLKKARRIAVNSIVAYKERYGLENESGLHRGSNVVYANFSPTAHPVKVVMFGDSFSEYRPHLLSGMLADTVREFHFIWSLEIDWNYVRRFEPDIIITETTERFMNGVPHDDLDLDHYCITTLAPLSWTITAV
jgi:alginate O-acetyltransferase complex protein AlgJ